MTRKHFEAMAAQIRAIHNGEWVSNPPSWADAALMAEVLQECDVYAANYARAVQTAEAYILLCVVDNPRFNVRRFLIACGLASK